MNAAELARKIRDREQCVGYWVVLDAPVATERLARLGYDYVALDAQHGLIGNAGLLANLMAVDAGGRSVGIVRVESGEPAAIGRALDFGAGGVIVPLVDTAEDAARAVSAARYPAGGRRSYGPMRSMLRIGPTPAEADESVLVLAMIETPDGLANLEAICATPGLDGVYVGPSDLCLAVGGRFPNDPDVAGVFDAALERIRTTAKDAGIAAGIHNVSGDQAARRLAEGFTFVTVASDLVHLEQAAAAHLKTARGQ
ncbi:aldolase [Nonomuraea sp. K274]|uniref:Aldolase n=1 Tax=Nonomuraea cypriaca TaxID=1187855 RepID=A0A931F2G1_9ACTN|nr:aldolase/citrate lyase family protein [Nonomuraea cypriaca]MBF8188603.1 aldolase [Nonomuraea cypriaca]